MIAVKPLGRQLTELGFVVVEPEVMTAEDSRFELLAVETIELELAAVELQVAAAAVEELVPGHLALGISDYDLVLVGTAGLDLAALEETVSALF